MLITVEGVDGSGKSTLVKQLCKYGVIHLAGENPFTRDSVVDIIKIIEIASKSNQLYVFDRSFITDIVYRFIDYKECAKYTLEDLYKFCKYTDIIIYCDNENAFENAMRRGETHITRKDISNQLRYLYRFVIDVLDRYDICDVIYYDFEQFSVEELLQNIKKLQKRRCKHAIR